MTAADLDAGMEIARRTQFLGIVEAGTIIAQALAEARLATKKKMQQKEMKVEPAKGMPLRNVP